MRTRNRWSIRTLLAMTLVVAGVGVAAAVSSITNKEKSTVVPEISTAELETAARTKVFLAHQSVGENILGGVRDVYAAAGVPAPPVSEGQPAAGGSITHAFIGENEKPLLKIQDFETRLRGGLGQSVDVAMLKFCYVDVLAGADVEALFNAYRTAIADLQREFPNLTFIHSTVPLTMDRDLGRVATVKSWFTADPFVADNATRERLNALIRAEYGDDVLFDIATVQSTEPDGTRAGGTHEGQRYFRLYEGYASDMGHLDTDGGQVAAVAWLKAVNRAAAR